ncbi:taurine ABC transporter substrate-binding protein [Vogesella sp. LIG4]|uniref:taurine ABC transporter substrate-binding protein n=1 Tax=Vogesella sp. LIG4 TaxID=1192162 RepID=UPI0008201AB4|nr:taurine ABC transporter substrate-binding protein [Vogesella sp. LIG4]SCK16594.1 taurine transport system substrate-binding protein [Vogesella sp. LIG4]
MTRPQLLSLFVSLALAAGTAHADDGVTIAFQTGVDPSKVAQADGDYEKATGKKINWRKFESGAEVIAAVASGDVPIGNIGSSPLAAAASRGLPIQTFLVTGIIGESEALVVRNGSGISKPADLAGKKIAVPYVSTTHYSLLAALKHWQVDAGKVTILNLRPSEIAAAWQRGDIDGAYVWEPALGKVKASGKVLTSSAEVSKWGAPTYDLWIVRQDFAQKNPDFLKQFVKVTGKVFERYNQNPKGFAADAANVDKIARLTGSKPEEVTALLPGNRYPSLQEQSALLQKPFVKAVSDTSAFLKSQGKVDSLQADYSPYVTNRFVQAALN